MLAQGRDIVPIPGTTRAGHRDQNLEALDIAPSAEDLAGIEAMAPKGATAGLRYPETTMVQVKG